MGISPQLSDEMACDLSRMWGVDPVHPLRWSCWCYWVLYSNWRDPVHQPTQETKRHACQKGSNQPQKFTTGLGWWLFGSRAQARHFEIIRQLQSTARLRMGPRWYASTGRFPWKIPLEERRTQLPRKQVISYTPLYAVTIVCWSSIVTSMACFFLSCRLASRYWHIQFPIYWLILHLSTERLYPARVASLVWFCSTARPLTSCKVNIL
jgi:hypothetical protein